jgi:hypothetical protein
MLIDMHKKSIQLLSSIANSVHERDAKNSNLLFFSTIEIQLVEDWLQVFCKEVKEDCVCLDA